MLDEVRDAAGEGPGLTGTGACDDEDGTVARRDRLELARIERCTPIRARNIIAFEHAFEYSSCIGRRTV